MEWATSKLLLQLLRPHPRARSRGQSIESAQQAPPLGGQVPVESHEHKVQMVTKESKYYLAAVLSHILAGANMDFTAADLLSAWIYQPNPANFHLSGYPVLLHSLAARGHEKRQKQNSARGVLYQKIQASFWRCLCDNFSKSDAQCIDICNPRKSVT